MTTYMHMPGQPVRVDADLDPQTSRGLWLVKWLLVIPHYVVLTFLWAVFIVFSVVAFFAILFTGRYPRAVFDFNVGVMRWTWRVAYYAYGALGTDRYPPFSLRDDPDYPAHLEVEYPQRLSRGLVLVKWWLLAIPHYIIVGILVGGGTYLTRAGDTEFGSWTTRFTPWTGGGLIGLLAVIAAVVLLFTGSYPRALFDLVLGLNRWVIRVAAYVGLMTDRYPPFRLDQGGQDPGTIIPSSSSPGVGAQPAAAVEQSPAEGRQTGQSAQATRHTSHWTAGLVVGAVVASLGALTSVGLLAGGSATAMADATMRDASGFLMSDSAQHLATPTYALTFHTVHVHATGVARSMPHRMLGEMKVSADSQNGKRLFVGIAPTAEAAAFLSPVRHATVLGRWTMPHYYVSQGGAPRVPPDHSRIWTAHTTGNRTTSLVVPVANGDWTLVVMNADGSASVDATVAVGLTAPGLRVLTTSLLISGGVLLVAAVVSLVLIVRAARGRRPPAAASYQRSQQTEGDRS